MNYHLAILKGPYLEMILDGRKTVESRFTLTRREPFGQIGAGDKILFKISSGPVCGEAIVDRVEEFDNLTAEKIFKLKEKYNNLILGGDEYWQTKSVCKFGVLVWVKDVRTIKPVRIDKKDWRAWVVLTEQKSFGLSKLLC